MGNTATGSLETEPGKAVFHAYSAKQSEVKQINIDCEDLTVV